MAANLSLVASSAPLKDWLLPKDSKILSPVLLNFLVSTKSQLTMSASQPAETLTSRRCCSPPWAPSRLSHSADSGACSPPMSECSMAGTWRDWKALETSQSTPLPGFSSPISTIPDLDYSKRPYFNHHRPCPLKEYYHNQPRP